MRVTFPFHSASISLARPRSVRSSQMCENEM